MPDIATDLVEAYRAIVDGSPPDALFGFWKANPTASAAELSELIAIDQQVRWRTPPSAPSAEQYLAAFSRLLNSERDRCDVVYGEFRARVLAGDRPDPREFLARFPDLEAALMRQWELSEWLSPEHHEETFIGEKRISSELETARATVTRAELSAPLRDDDFSIIRKLGSGGMGDVFLARQKSLQKDVALKWLNETSRLAPAALERFFHEAHAVARLRHPHVVGVHGIGRGADGYFLLMDYIDGSSLAERLKSGPLSVSEALGIALPLCDALQQAHERGIVHRDLKPSNILIDSGGRPFLTDFGIAKWATSHLSGLTEPGQILGTPQYMAPEQFDPDLGPIGPATDIYGMGGLLFAMLTGNAPVSGRSIPEAMRNLILSERPPSIREHRPELPLELDELVQGCLSRQPGQRPATMETLAARLKTLPIDSKPEPARKPGSASPRKSARAVIATILAALLGLGVLLWTWSRHTPVVPTDSSGKPALADWRIDAFRGGLVSRAERIVSGAAPLKSGDSIRMIISLREPRFVSLYWLGSSGRLSLVESSTQPVDRLEIPRSEQDGLPITGKAGTEMGLLVLRSTPWDDGSRKAFEEQVRISVPPLTSDVVLIDGRVAPPADDAASELLKSLADSGRDLGQSQPLAESEYDRRMQSQLSPLARNGSEIHYIVLQHQGP